jgi:pimeloyl-ACP methyl ester carboxylesterase
VTQAAIGDITIGYDDSIAGGAADRGDAVLLVHGHPFDHSMWAPQVAHATAAGWRVVVPDLRGYGETTVVPGATTLETFARDAIALLDHLGVDAFVLGGLSMGGQIAMELVRLFPERVRGLLLADTSSTAETDAGKAERNAVADRLIAGGDEGMADYADELLPRMVAPVTLTERRPVADHVLAMMRSTPAAGAAAALRGRAERPDYDATLAALTVPTLVVVGDDDTYTPVAEAQRMHDLIPGSSLVVVEGTGHLPNLERPDEFNAAFDGLLRAVAVSGSAAGD